MRISEITSSAVNNRTLLSLSGNLDTLKTGEMQALAGKLTERVNQLGGYSGQENATMKRDLEIALGRVTRAIQQKGQQDITNF